MAATEMTSNVVNQASGSVFSTETIGPFLGSLVIFIMVFYIFFYLTTKQTRSMIKENNAMNQEMMKLALENSAQTSLAVGRDITKELIASITEHFTQNTVKLDRSIDVMNKTNDTLLVLGNKIDMVLSHGEHRRNTDKK